MTVAQPGLRERKKQRTRELIAHTARGLFVERGFDHVSVAEIARVADVAEKTVFNYFPTKEDLVYWRLEAFESRLLDTIRQREMGEPAFAAFARFISGQRGWFSEKDPDARERAVAMTRMITESPALLARERQVFDGYTANLAALLAEETQADPGDIVPRAAAGAMIGVHRALVDYARRGILAGVPRARLAREVSAQAEQAVAALEAGLGTYAVRAPA